MKVNIGNFSPRNGQKIDVRIDYWDTFGLDHTLAHIILPALIQLRASKHGIPCEFGDVGGEQYGSQSSFDFYQETYNEAFSEGAKRWDVIMDKMIWSFQQIAVCDYDDQYHHGKPRYSWKKTGEKILNPLTGNMEETSQMIDENPGEHWFDADGQMLHEERIQEGLDLFGKYYRNLWD